MKAAALELGLPVVHRVEEVLEAGADLGVVVAYGRLIRRPVLERLGFVNLHFSLLPRWRGAAPVERALLAGDAETGVCLMQLEEGLDTGPVFAHRRVPIDSRVTADALRRQLVEVGSELLCTTLDTGLHDPTPQEGEVTYAAKLTPADLEIDWGAGADTIDRVVRVGGAWTTWRGRRLKVLDAEPVDAGRPGRGRRAGTRDAVRRRGGHRLGPVAPPHRPAGGQAGDGRRVLAARRPPRAGRPAGGLTAATGVPSEAMTDPPSGAGLAAKVLTVSDGVVHGTREDRSGVALVERLAAEGYSVVDHRVVADGTESVAAALTELADGFAGVVVSTGGTGFTPRDLTPEGTKAVVEREAPGLAEAMRLVSPLGRLSRGIAGIRGQAVILNTPGSPKGCVEQLEAVLDVLPHALRLLAETPTDH